MILSLCACGGNTDEPVPTDTPNTIAENETADFARFEGTWHLTESEYENAAPAETAPVIEITANGTFAAYEEDETESATGYLKYEDEEIEDTSITWVTLYTDDGEYYLGFVDEGQEAPTDFYVGNGAVDHYTLQQ